MSNPAIQRLFFSRLTPHYPVPPPQASATLNPVSRGFLSCHGLSPRLLPAAKSYRGLPEARRGDLGLAHSSLSICESLPLQAESLELQVIPLDTLSLATVHRLRRASAPSLVTPGSLQDVKRSECGEPDFSSSWTLKLGDDFVDGSCGFSLDSVQETGSVDRLVADERSRQENVRRRISESLHRGLANSWRGIHSSPGGLNSGRCAAQLDTPPFMSVDSAS